MRRFLIALQTVTVSLCLHAEDAPDALFVRRIEPLIQEKCLACHGKDREKIKSDYDMTTRESFFRGGESGEAAVVPGKPEKSPVYLSVLRTHDDWEPMPPKENDKLTAEQIGWIKAWIAGGAPWPDDAKRKELAKLADKWAAEEGIPMKTSGGLGLAWTNRRYKPESMWAYQPVKRARNSELGIRNGEHPVDALIAAKMPEGLKPAPPADALTFIRRATFDLTGLPPTPDEIAAFEADSTRNPQSAIRNLIDRLLASPHYGERMAQHWLDVVRYADSSGFANDYERGNAWRYRDYVVRSFNADKPYDQFIREQIAGDELDPKNPEMLVATGFLRMGPWELTGMEVAKVARQRFLDDVTNSVGETFLAHSLQCARCHDHKFDPVPTRDYYSIQAVFATTQLSERQAPFLPVENVSGFDERKYLESRRAEYIATLEDLDAKLVKNAEVWFREKGVDPAKWNAAIAQAQSQERGARGNKRRGFEGAFNTARGILTKQGVPEDQFPPKLHGFAPVDYGNERVARKGLERLQWELDRYEPFALAVYNGRTPEMKSVYAPIRIPANRMTEGQLEETCVLTGGDPFASGEKVQPGVLSVIGEVQKSPIPAAIEGRRRAFAEWVASPGNPLTTRTIVNRVWLWHFDQPIAGNPNNFGSTGKRPTHPELLDWLAATFVEQGWSFKAMHRLIMTSEAYRRGPSHPDQRTLAEKDPTGTSYAVFKPRRLTAEEMRDAMLAATGELNPTLGGIPNRPEINLEAALQPRQVMGTFAAAWIANPRPEQRHRRSIYALKTRGLRDPFMEVFNEPAPDFSCEAREASTVTPQVFSLFNGQATNARALALAHRALKDTSSDEAALKRCFQLTYGRAPRSDELRTCLAHWREMEGIQKTAKLEPARPPLEVKREAVEENTGEKFVFSEKLDAYTEFVPDLQPTDVDARTRALADVCLVLLNSNEFAYVY
jgi:mono/diheme cytochrome c family protein